MTGRRGAIGGWLGGLSTTGLTPRLAQFKVTDRAAYVVRTGLMRSGVGEGLA